MRAPGLSTGACNDGLMSVAIINGKIGEHLETLVEVEVLADYTVANIKRGSLERE